MTQPTPQCPNGHPVRLGAGFCPVCGAPIAQPEATTPSGSQRPLRRFSRRATVIAAAVVLLVAGGATAGVVLASKSGTPHTALLTGTETCTASGLLAADPGSTGTPSDPGYAISGGSVTVTNNQELIVTLKTVTQDPTLSGVAQGTSVLYGITMFSDKTAPDVATVHGKKVTMGRPLPVAIWGLDYDLYAAGVGGSLVAHVQVDGSNAGSKYSNLATPTVSTGPGTVTISESLAQTPVMERGFSWNIVVTNGNVFGAASNYKVNTFSDTCPNGSTAQFNSAVGGTTKLASGAPPPPTSSPAKTPVAPTATAPATTQAPATTIPATEVLDVSPVTANGIPKPAYTIINGGQATNCENGSEVLGDAYRCFAGNGVYDPCWADTASAPSLAVLCLAEPYDTKATMLTVSSSPTTVSGLPVAGGLQPFTSPTPIDRQRPWAVQLADGQRCAAVQSGASNFNGQRVNYECGANFNGPQLYGSFNESGAIWTAQSDTRNPATGALTAGPNEQIITAWYGVPEAPQAVTFSNVVSEAQIALRSGEVPGAGAVSDAVLNCPDPVAIQAGNIFACTISTQQADPGAILIVTITSPPSGLSYKITLGANGCSSGLTTTQLAAVRRITDNCP